MTAKESKSRLGKIKYRFVYMFLICNFYIILQLLVTTLSKTIGYIIFLISTLIKH